MRCIFVKQMSLYMEIWAWGINPLLLWWAGNVVIKYLGLHFSLLTYSVAFAAVCLFTVFQFLVCETVKVVKQSFYAVDSTRFEKNQNGDLVMINKKAFK